MDDPVHKLLNKSDLLSRIDAGEAQDFLSGGPGEA